MGGGGGSRTGGSMRSSREINGWNGTMERGGPRVYIYVRDREKESEKWRTNRGGSIKKEEI